MRSFPLRLRSVTPLYEHVTPLHVHTSVFCVQFVRKSPLVSVSASRRSISEEVSSRDARSGIECGGEAAEAPKRKNELGG